MPGPFKFTTFDKEKASFSFIAISDIHEDSSKLTTMLNNISWNGVDLTLTGHTHEFARRDPDKDHIYYEVTNSTSTTTRVDVYVDKLVLTITELDGSVIDRLTIIPAKKTL